MARKTATAGLQQRYWEQRVRSPAFRRDLTALIERELVSVSGERVKGIVNPQSVRRAIREWTVRIVDPDRVVDFLTQGNRSVAHTLTRRGGSLLGLLDAELVASIDALLAEDMQLSRHAEDFVAKIMDQEFVRRLFTDIIFTSIVSFYERVNPFFGALAMRALEDQIKGFIRLFMPMIQSEATAFALSKSNQRILLDFTRSIIRQLLDEPLARYAAMISSGQRKKARALLRKAVEDAELESLIRTVAVAVWDDLYKRIRDKKVGDLLRLEEHAGWLAPRCVDVILPALARPQIAQFVAAEIALGIRANSDRLPPPQRPQTGS